MMRHCTMLLWAGVLMCISCASSAHNILGLFPTQAKSAFLANEAVMKGLARRGHNVTVISSFPQEHAIPNYTDISVREFRPTFVSSFDLSQLKIPLDLLDMTPFFTTLIESMGSLLESRELLDLLSSNITFDVVFHEMFVDDVFLMVAKRFNAPIIAMGPSYIPPWAADRFAIPQNPSYIPVLGNGFSGNMEFLQRLSNTISNVRNNLNYWLEYVPRSVRTYERHLGEPAPPVRELMKEVSLLFVNTHFSYTGARPYPPQVVEIGGVHVQPAKQLPQELAGWMEESAFGVICFSFGSILRGATLPADRVKVFLEVFKRIPQRVVWKWEDDKLEGLPVNVRIMKWLPQRDVLAHPNVKLFISHGGLLGTTEAIFSGVPILGIPTNMDQSNNVARLVDTGAAMFLDYNNITVESLFYVVQQLLHDQQYSENAKLLSRRFLDRPQSPLETAVYWTEYVIRHRGAPHLQSAAVHLSWYQYYLLDVAAVCLAGLLFMLALIFYILRFCPRLVISTKSTKLKTN